MLSNAIFKRDSGQHLDPGRILGIAAAIAVNLSIFAVLMQPMTYKLLTVASDPVVAVPFIVPKKEPIEVTRNPPPKKPQITHMVKVRTPPKVEQRPPVVTNDATAMSKPVETIATPPLPPVADPGPPQTVHASLLAVDSPAPAYPADLVRDGVTGTVQLELLVGTDGRVIEVNIVHSSGNRELDKVAREQVLRNWRFQPAMLNGAPVQALGRVPIVFTLDGR